MVAFFKDKNDEKTIFEIFPKKYSAKNGYGIMASDSDSLLSSEEETTLYDKQSLLERNANLIPMTELKTWE